MTAIHVISTEDAEEYTQALGQVVAGSWRQIAWAARMGIPEALGMTTRDWVETRLGGYIKMQIPERREAVAELAEEGMSQREIGDVLGVDHATVNRDLNPAGASAPNGIPARTEPQAAPPTEVPLGADSPPEPDEVPPSSPQWPDEQTAEWQWPEAGDEEGAAKPEPEDAEATPAAEPETPVAHVGRNSGDNEWYTPAEYIKAATAVMGAIDLDPASSTEANEVVAAAAIYTEDDDGLHQPWAGRVWMNPPYAQPLVDRFCTSLARQYDKGNGRVTEACVLVNNATETNWFQEVLGQATAVCFPRGRIKFWHPRKEATPLQGQAVVYLGPHVAEFKAEFLRFGPVGVF